MKIVEEIACQCRFDEDIHKLAYREKRMLLTQNNDYLSNRKFPIDKTPDIPVIIGCSGYQDMNAILAALPSNIVLFGETWNQSKIKVTSDTMATTARNINTAKTKENHFTLSSEGQGLVWMEETEDQS